MKNKRFSVLSCLLCLALLFSLTACEPGGAEGDGPAVNPGEDENPVVQAETVIDAAGREVTVPEKVERIVITCRGGSTNEVAIFGGADRIVGQPSQGAYPQLLAMYPHFEDLTDPGSFEDTNIEEVMSLQPDIVFAGISSPKANAKLEETGLTVYTMQIGWATTETIREEFINMGKLLDNEEQAEKLVAYWDEKLALVEELLQNIPQEERKTVYYTGKTIEAANSGDWGVSWIEGSGGITVVDSSFNGEINVEQVMEWNPDLIITQGGNGKAGLLEDERIQELSAIQNRAVYECPIGAFWWDRPSPESPLAFMWLAQTMYPEVMQAVDLKQETLDFYRNFYGYELSDAEYEGFFFP